MKTKPAVTPIDPFALERHVRHLTEKIGVRLAGSANETAAGHYLAEQFEAAGARVSREIFSTHTRAVRSQALQVFHDGAWHEATCSLLAFAPGTDDRWVEAPLAWHEAATAYQRDDLAAHLQGKIVLHLGTHIETPDDYRRLIAAQPAAILMVDVRYPGATPLADAIFPHYARTHGAVTTLNVAFLDAWRWREHGATRARLCVDGGMLPADSANIVAELPGSDPAAGVVYLGAHHDTQADSVGADDNASGCAGLVELARVLKDRPRRRTLRLISFGVEEQLSVGSAAYVRRHRDELHASGRAMFNLDSFGSLLGWNVINGTLPPALEPILAEAFRRHGQFFRRDPSVQPYFDHFPFLAAGVPSLSLIRYNCAAGRFFHHRPDDTLDRLDVKLMATLLDSVADFIGTLANEDLPENLASPADRTAIDRYWEELFGAW